MINNSIKQLENNETYAVIDTISGNQGTYIYFSNIKDENDLCVRKQLKNDQETILVGLDNKEEVDYALHLLIKKNLAA